MSEWSMTRRQMLRGIGAALAAPAVPVLARAAENRAAPVPVRTISRGPKHHWFGYYDKREFDPTDRFVLSNEVDFEHRTPRADDRINIGMIDTREDDKWIPLGVSRAWCWQQGCMLQWRPGSQSEVLWNDRQDGRHVCRVLDVRTGEKRTIPRPVYALAPDGRYAVTADFARIQTMRPGYGYVGVADPARDVKAPETSGVWRVDLETGEVQLILTLANVAKIEHHGESLKDCWHYFNHLLVSPNGDRLIVLHRWRKSTVGPSGPRPSGGFTTRMFTVGMDGSDPCILDSSGHTSHFIWRDPQHVCAWTRPPGKRPGFYLFKDRTRAVTPVGAGVMTRNGHNTYLPLRGREWILNDTYPDSKREQTLYLFHIPTGRRHELGRFHLPRAYSGEWRCDLHPRSSNDGMTVAIDSPHTGQGRQIHLIDIRGIVA